LCTEMLGYRDWDIVHDKMVEFLWKSEKSSKLIMVPRGHLKSSIFTIGWSIQQILRNPNIRILISNTKWGNAKNFLHQIKSFLTDFSRLPELFGKFKDDKRYGGGWNRENVIVAQRNETKPEPTLQTSGVESEQTSQHYDVIIHDDIVARDNINTKESREKVKNYYRDSMSLLEPSGLCVVIGTPWHDDDLYVDLRKDVDFDVFAVKAYEKWVDTKGKEHIDLVFPKKFTYPILMKKKKDIGPYLFSAQYMLNPYPDEAQEFKKSWLQYYDELPAGDYYITTTLDPSLGKKTSDWAGITTSAIDVMGNVYVLEARRFKRMVELIPEECLKTVAKFKSNVFGLESFGFQQTLERPIRRKLEENKLGTMVNLLPYKSMDKATRIQGLIPKFSSGEIFIKRNMADLEDELLKFNPTRKHATDDIIDSLAWHVLYWDRKPDKKDMRRIEPGTFGWLMKQNKLLGQKNDVFWDFRGTKTQWVR